MHAHQELQTTILLSNHTEIWCFKTILSVLIVLAVLLCAWFIAIVLTKIDLYKTFFSQKNCKNLQALGAALPSSLHLAAPIDSGI